MAHNHARAIVSMADVWDVLDAKALSFAAWLNANVDARLIIQTSREIDINGHAFQTILNQALTDGAITQTEVDAFTAEIGKIVSPSFGE